MKFCTVCGSEVYLHSKMANRVFYLCPECFFLQDHTTYENIQEVQSKQASQGGHLDFYLSKSKEETIEKIEKQKRLFFSVLERLNLSLDEADQITEEKWSDLNLCDFGGAGGLSILALRDFFKSIIVIDVDTFLFEKHLNELGYHDARRDVLLQSFRTVSAGRSVDIENTFDIVFSWHVLEHFPNQLEFIHEVKSLLKKDGLLLMQVPMLSKHGVRNETHYTYHNGVSLKKLLTDNGFSVLDIRFDEELQYLTCFAKLMPSTNQDSLVKYLRSRTAEKDELSTLREEIVICRNALHEERAKSSKYKLEAESRKLELNRLKNFLSGC